MIEFLKYKKHIKYILKLIIMKRIILTITMALGICTFVNAQTTPTEKVAETTATTAVQTTNNDGFTKVEMNALNEKVQTAIKTNYTNFTVKALAYNAEKKLTKVTFISKEGKEAIVILNDEGKEVKE